MNALTASLDRLGRTLVEKGGAVGLILACQIGAPVEVLKAYWGRRYHPTDVQVLSGATFDTEAPVHHTIVFRATIEGRTVTKWVALDRSRQIIDLGKTSPDLFTLPRDHQSSGTIGMMVFGALPGAIAAVAGLPIFVARRLYFKTLEQDAAVYGLSVEHLAFYEAIRSELSPSVRGLLHTALTKLQAELQLLDGAIRDGFDDLKVLLANCDQIMVMELGVPLYVWHTDSRMVAACVIQDNWPDETSGEQKEFTLTIDRARNAPDSPLHRFTQAQIQELIGIYRSRTTAETRKS